MEVRARLSILVDSNNTEDSGIRNPDNVDWSDEGMIYAEEASAIDSFDLKIGGSPVRCREN